MTSSPRSAKTAATSDDRISEIDRSGLIADLLSTTAQDREFWLDGSGTSMTPVIESGDRLRVVAARRRPRRGEVWSFCLADETILAHRCVGRGPSGGFVFRGDACARPDPDVRRDQLIGRVVESVRDGRPYRRFGALERARWAAWVARGRLKRR